MNGQKNQSTVRDLPIVNAAERLFCPRKKNYILPRGKGKTTRILSIADYLNAPVICASESRRSHVISECRQWGYIIPAVYTADDLVKGKLIGTSRKNYVVDDADDVLQALIEKLSGGKANIVATSATISKEDDEFER